MDKKLEKQIFFILLILVIILFSLSQIFPWATLNFNSGETTMTMGSFYSWGFESEPPIPSDEQSTRLYITMMFDTFNEISETCQERTETIEYIKTVGIGYLFLFVTWIISILTIVVSAFSFYNLINLKDVKMKKNIFTTSIYSIIVIILFYLIINFLIIDPANNMIKSIYDYEYLVFPYSFNYNLQFSIGFFLFIIGLIIITGLQVYILLKKFSKKITE
jgi:hypothetical protein